MKFIESNQAKLRPSSVTIWIWTWRAGSASQVGSLIWEADETVTVRRDSLATILKLVEDGLLTHTDADDLDLTELQAALAELHTAMASHGIDPNGDTK